VTGLPDDILAALAAEETMLAEPWAGLLDAYNRPAEPVTPAEFAAMVEKAMRDMWNYPPRPSEPSPWRCVVHPGEWVDAAGCPACCRIGRQRADRRDWIESVRERLQSAVYAASNGYVWSWTAPGVFGVPGLPETLQVRHEGQPWRPTDGKEVAR